MQRLSHVVAFDDAPFDRAHRGDVALIGTVFAGLRLDGVLRGRVRRDGANAARVMACMIAASKFVEHLQLVMLQGIAVAGFNVVDVFALHRLTGLPVLVVSKRLPDLDAIRSALLTRVPGGARKWRILERLGPMEPCERVYVQRVALTLDQSATVIRRLALHAREPEPLRVAHLIASAFTRVTPVDAFRDLRDRGGRGIGQVQREIDLASEFKDIKLLPVLVGNPRVNLVARAQAIKLASAMIESLSRDAEYVCGEVMRVTGSGKPSCMPPPARPVSGRIVARLCGRDAPSDEVRTLLAVHRTEKEDRPVVLFVPGVDEDRPEAFVEALIETWVRPHVTDEDTAARGTIAIPWPGGYSVDSTLNAVKSQMLQYLGLPARDVSDDAFLAAIAALPRCGLIVSHTIRATMWDALETPLSLSLEISGAVGAPRTARDETIRRDLLQRPLFGRRCGRQGRCHAGEHPGRHRLGGGAVPRLARNRGRDSETRPAPYRAPPRRELVRRARARRRCGSTRARKFRRSRTSECRDSAPRSC